MTSESSRSGPPPEPRPVGPLGAAFADLVDAPPPSTLTAQDVMVLDWAARERRGAWTRRIGVAAAAVVIGGLGVLGVRSLGGLSSDATSAGGAPEAAATSFGTGAAAPQFPMSGTVSSQDALSSAKGIEPTACPPSVPISAAQSAVVVAQLPGAAVAPAGCGTAVAPQPATGVFRAGPMFIEVEIAEPAGPLCPAFPSSTPALLCAEVPGHPGVLLSYSPGSGELRQANLVRVGLVSGNRGVTVRVMGFDGAPNPYTADQLATLVETLATTS
jgi:hypothetical protein